MVLKDRAGQERFVRRCLDAYDVGALVDWESHGGTAAGTWRVRTERGLWLLRTRGVRTSGAANVAFDHGLRRHLAASDIPTACPVRARDGRGCVQVNARTMELYPWVRGRCLAAADDALLPRVAGFLARFHQVSMQFPLARSLPPVAQYSTLGVSDPDTRMENPELLARIYGDLSARVDAADYAEAVVVSRAWLARLLDRFGRERYEMLPHTVTHGDFTLANLLFDRRGAVVGVFDFDWARWAPRIRDIADGMLFIAGQRQSPLRAGDIWSLTEAPSLRLDRCSAWLRGCQALTPLSPEEVRALPLAAAARWLSIRVEGVAKVPDSDKLRFCFGNLAAPLLWLDTNWAAVARELLQAEQ